MLRRLLMLLAVACAVVAATAAPAAASARPWPVPVPGWFWEWAQWYLGHGPYRDAPFRSDATRPGSAPARIPAWAWRRLQPMIGSSALPRNAADYARALYDAWRDDDRDTAARLATDDALHALLAREWELDDGWLFNRCEGAAGSVYCDWATPSERLVVRVASERASRGRPDAVVEVRFEPR